MRLRGIKKTIAFISIWIILDSFFNNYLMRQPCCGALLSRNTDIYHWILYGILGVISGVKRGPGLFLLFFLWAFMDEGIQLFLPDRVASWLDIVQNLSGLFAGWIVIFVFREVISASASKEK